METKINTSSTLHTLSIHKKKIPIINKYCKAINMKYINKIKKEMNMMHLNVIDLVCCFRNIQELDEYTTGRPYDWASKPRGVIFHYLDETYYNLCKQVIKTGRVIVIIYVDYTITNIFYDKWENNIIR